MFDLHLEFLSLLGGGLRLLLGIVRGHGGRRDLRELRLHRGGRPLRRMHRMGFRAMAMLVRLDERIAALERVGVVVLLGDRGLVVHNEPTALARRAFLGERLHKPLTDALARHLHQAQRCDLGHLVLGAVARQAFEQAAQHQVAVGWHDHIHVIDHDHAADVAQAQLARDLLARLEVAARHGLFERLALADEATGVHVDRGHGLGAVDHNGAAARQVHLTFHALAQLRVDLPLVEHILALMLGRIPLLQLLAQVGGHGLEVFLDARVHAIALHDHLAEVVVEDVAHHADRHVRLALQQLGALAVLELLTLGLDLLPLVQQHLQILGDRLL